MVIWINKIRMVWKVGGMDREQTGQRDRSGKNERGKDEERKSDEN